MEKSLEMTLMLKLNYYYIRVTLTGCGSFIKAISFLKRKEDHSGWTMDTLTLISKRLGSSFMRWHLIEHYVNPAKCRKSQRLRQSLITNKIEPNKANIFISLENLESRPLTWFDFGFWLTGSGENPLIRNQGTTAEKSVINEHSHLPFPNSYFFKVS
jgi:hypothetical protein